VSTATSDTVAEGLEIRVPVPESVARLLELVDDIVLVDDEDMLRAMRVSLDTLGIVLEPSGAAGLAAPRATEPTHG
jgi:threonine dehydratase